MSIVEDEEKRWRKAIEAVIDLADSNFPSRSDIRVEAIGNNTASVVLPAWYLRSMLKPPVSP